MKINLLINFCQETIRTVFFPGVVFCFKIFVTSWKHPNGVPLQRTDVTLPSPGMIKKQFLFMISLPFQAKSLSEIKSITPKISFDYAEISQRKKKTTRRKKLHFDRGNERIKTNPSTISSCCFFIEASFLVAAKL